MLARRAHRYLAVFATLSALPLAAFAAATDRSAYEAGRAALQARDYAAAAEAFDEATRIAPDDKDAWFDLGIARSALKQWPAAIRAYDRTIALDPENARAHHNLGNVYFRKGDFEPAAESYGRALELDPDYMLAAFHHGWTLRQLNRSAEAEQAFRRCMEIPGDEGQAARTKIDCVFGLASLRQRAGDYEESAAMMEQVLSVHPMHLEARYYLAMAYRQLGRVDEAREQLEIHRKMLQARRTAMGQDPPVEP